MKEQCDFPAFTAYRLEDDILHIEMKKVNKLYAQDVEQINDCYLKVGKGGKVYSLITFQGFIPISTEAMKEAAKKRKYNIEGAKAYVVKSIALRMGVEFFMNFYTHKYPIAIFSTTLKAIAWLREQKIKDNKIIEVLV
ncbi:MAG: hypothetical protein HY840_00825 [Bacteroidetes bacterium]|nr:hypothetical protein [Bacteroidota bacterium]